MIACNCCDTSDKPVLVWFYDGEDPRTPVDLHPNCVALWLLQHPRIALYSQIFPPRAPEEKTP